MQLENASHSEVFYCSYTRNTDVPAHVSRPFGTIEEARDEAAALRWSGYWGMIERATRFTPEAEATPLSPAAGRVEIIEQF